MPEVVSHKINNAPAVAEFYASQDWLADPEVRRSHLSELSSVNFLDLTQQVNAVIRSGDSESRQHFDGDGVTLHNEPIPDQADKEQLLHEVWDTAKTFLTDKDLSTDDALMYAGLVVAGGFLYVHPFMDSNGRTSRVLHHMFTEGSSREGYEDDLRAMSGHGGNTEWQTTPQFLKPYVNVQPTELGESVELPPKVITEEEDYIHGDLTDDSGGIVGLLAHGKEVPRALRIFIEKGDDTVRDIMKKHTSFDDKGKPLELDAKGALTELVHMGDKGLGYAAQFREAERAARADFVRKFLTAMRTSRTEKVPKDYADRIRVLQEAGQLSSDIWNLVINEALLHLDDTGKILPIDLYRTEHVSRSRIHRARNHKSNQTV